MRKTFAILGVVALLAMGCKDMNNNNSSSSGNSNDPKMMSTQDDCPHCPGNQTADATGHCPVCGAKVK